MAQRERSDSAGPSAEESAAVWREIEAEPGFRERLASAIKRMDVEGQGTPYQVVRRRLRPDDAGPRGGAVPGVETRGSS
jgi:hypothetical protein